jgi:hypothetical protein
MRASSVTAARRSDGPGRRCHSPRKPTQKHRAFVKAAKQWDDSEEARKYVDEHILRARAYLSRVAEPPTPALVELIAEIGPVEAAERVRTGQVGEDVAAEISTHRGVDRVAEDLAAARAAGARLITPEHPEWPTKTFAAFGKPGQPQLTPPLALWVRGPGQLNLLSEQAVAVVGARAATGYGVHGRLEQRGRRLATADPSRWESLG